VKLLLDTHALLCYALDDSRLSCHDSRDLLEKTSDWLLRGSHYCAKVEILASEKATDETRIEHGFGGRHLTFQRSVARSIFHPWLPQNTILLNSTFLRPKFIRSPTLVPVAFNSFRS
jgi:hypothetical protein